jgi:uncharacterized protein (DUF1501 family)
MIRHCGLHTFSRRDFLKRSSSIAAAATLSANSLGLAGLLRASDALASNEEYKALVFVFLNGGNDSFNMIVPTGSSQLRTNYVNNRGIVALSEQSLNPLNLQSTPTIYGDTIETSEFGMHAECADLAEMFNNQELAVLCNIGNLVMPITRDEYINNSLQVADLPPRLFSHSDQQRQFQSEPISNFSYGWGGRMAEFLTQYNTNSLVSPLISVAGLNPFQVSLNGEINAYSLSADGIRSLNGFSGARSLLVNNSMDSIDASAHLMAQKYASVYGSAVDAETIVQSVFNIADATGVDFDDIFAAAGVSAESIVGSRLKTVARMIAGRSTESNKRPIYFVEMNGFDTHANMLPNHNARMEELNAALKAFRDCLHAQSDFDKVLTYVGSEFGRTLTPNGNDPATAGTDHAWGGNVLTFGGMVEGGRFYGTFPDLRLNQGLDVGRGRFIPTHSSSQCSAIIASWMGIPNDDINQIFPTLSNFPDPFDVNTNINFISQA